MEKLIEAAAHADWAQVILNGGPPCFMLERHGRHENVPRFCLRAERWLGHTDKDEWPEHRFISLRDLLDKL